MNSLEKPSPRRPLVADLNPNLMCRLCGGYYVDAAAIIECLHTFCKSCLVRYLETNKYCPVCDVQVHKSRPLQNIRLDPTLQDMVYKLVPGLYHREMKSRREFYSTRPDAPPSSLDDRGDVPPELCPFYTPDEPVCLVLEYRAPEVAADPTNNNKDLQNKRFLRCPAAVKITHLEKLLRNKYGLDNRYNIDLMLEDSKLSPDLTLMDVAYAFGRKRKGQFLFTYRIYDTQCKKMRLSGDTSEMDTLPAPTLPSEEALPTLEPKPEPKKEPETVSSDVPERRPSEPPACTTSTATCVVTSLYAPTVTTRSVTTPVSSAPVFSAYPSPAPFSSAPINLTAVSSTPLSSAPVSSTLVSSAPVSSVSVSSVTVSSASFSSARVSSAPISKSLNSFSNTTISVVSAAPVVCSPAPSVTTSSAPVTTATPAASAVAPTPLRAASTVAPSTLTITPVTSSTSSTSSVTSVSSLTSATAPSLAAPVQRLNPATVKAVSGNALPDKTTNVSSTDKSNKLNSIISRLGDPSKFAKPESAAPKKENSFRKPEGMEVQLRINENGEMITNVVNSDKTSSPVPKAATPPKPAVKANHSTKSPAENPASSESAPKQSAVFRVSPRKQSAAFPPPPPRRKYAAFLPPPPPSLPPPPPKPRPAPVGYKTLKATSPATVGYKTLKATHKGWNPTISRNSFLSAKLEQQLQKAQQNQDNSSKSATSEPVVKPPRFFKARNTPRYLGNPASGVKPMYQIASPPPSVQKPSPKLPSKSPSVLKLDPKTLTPIMSSSAAASPPPTAQAKDRPPFLSTTISGSHNHLPSSRSVTTTSTSVTENAPKMSSADLAMRNAPTPHPYMRFLSLCDPLNPFSPRLGDPNRIPSSPPYASLLRAPFSPLLVNSYGLSPPPPAGMLYNQPLHRQVNHTGPLSPVPGLPSPLTPAPALLSPSSTPKNIIPPVQWGPLSPSSPAPQNKVPLLPKAIPSKKSSTEVLPKTADKQTKLNGENPPVKDKVTKKADDVPVKTSAEPEKKEGDSLSTSVMEKREEAKSSEQDNNNTVVIEKKPVKSAEPVKQSQPLSHDISKLCSPTPPPKESPTPKVPSLPADQVVTVQVKQT